MKRITYWVKWAAILAVLVSHPSRSDTIVDTGAPNQTGFPLTLSDGQWLAAEFSTSQNWQINSLAGYMTADTLNPDHATFTVAIYGNGANNRPDANTELFSQQATFTSDGWNGLQGLNFSLNAGAYWLAFEVRSTDTLQGLMPVFSPNPLPTAANDPTTNFGYIPASGASYHFGVQINGTPSAVPLPPVAWLFVSGLFALGRFRQRSTGLN